MHSLNNSAIILAAGRGERLRPFTDKIPKPLIPVLDKPLIVYLIEKLARYGIKNIIINISYLAEEFKNTLKNGSQFGVNIIYSEEPEALETGGGIFNALPLLENRNNPFFVISGDIFTNYNFSQLFTAKFLQQFNEKNLHAHLILVPNPTWHPGGDFGINSNHFLQLKKNPIQTYTYASMGIFHERMFVGCQSGKYRLSPLLDRSIQQHKITGEVYDGNWYNIGTLADYQKLCYDVNL